MIKINELVFGYKKKNVINGISFTLERGELCSLIGTNGSGKTTLIRLIDRSLTPRGGSVTVDSILAADHSAKEYARKISRLPQSRGVPSVSVADLIAGGRYPYLGFSGKLTENDIQKLNAAIELTDTAHLLSRDMRELSGGERQRVYFAMLLAQDTPYVLLDEPATFLDVAAQIELYSLIKKLKDMGKGILSVSHDLSFALKYSDKILLLENGKAAFYGTPSDPELLASIEKVFGVRCLEQVVDGEKEYFFKEELNPHDR